MKKYITTEAFPEPNFTQVPNRFFEMLAEEMESSEVRVTLVMIRETYGYHREDFKLGIGKLAKAAGLSRGAVKDGAEAAEKRGTFVRVNPDEQGEAEWRLVVGQPVTPINEYMVGGQPLYTPPSTIDPQVGVKESINKDKEIFLTSKEKDLVDGYVKYQILPTTIRTAVHEYFRLNTNWDTKIGREWLEWAVGASVTPEQLKRAADTWHNDKAFNWQTPTLKGIFEKWQMLMDASPVAVQHKVYNSADDEVIAAVPAPARMR